MSKVYENVFFEGRYRNFFYDSTRKGEYLEKINIYCSDEGLFFMEEDTLVELLKEQRARGEMFSYN